MNRYLKGLLVGLVSALLAWGTGAVGWLDTLEYGTWSFRIRSLAQPVAATEQIKIILIDQASLDWAAKENSLAWPWMRQAYVPILQFCRRAGAKVIAFDMLYTEPSSYGVADDEAFGKAIAAKPDFVGAYFSGEEANQVEAWPADVARPSLVVAGLDAWLTPARRAVLADPKAAFPVQPVAQGAARLATIRLVPDEDGVFRRITPFRWFDGQLVPTLGMAAYLLGQGNVKDISVDDRAFHFGETTLPIDSLGRMILNYRGPGGAHQAFGAAAIIQSELLMQEGKPPTIDPDLLRDRYVFLGASAPGLKDLKPAPMDGDYPGVELHATLLDNLLARDAMRDAPRVWSLAFLLLLSVAAAVAVLHAKVTWQNIAVFIVFTPVTFAVGTVAYQQGLWWPVAETGVGAALALVGAVILNYATEGRQKRFIKSAFKQYLGETVIDEIIADPSRLKLGGEKKELTMFFSDLEKFSSFSEKLEPPQLIDLLNAYLSDVGKVLMEEGAYLDKFIGDAIVAFWNAPVPQADHARRAVRAALRCQRLLAEKQADYSARAAGMPVRMRIGLNTGDVVVGNMGSADRFNYTMLGDAANLASRLEGANKAFGTFLMVAESTWKQVGDAVIGREMGQIRVVGRKTPVRVFEPLALAGESAPAWLPAYEKGLAAVRAGQWSDAASVFSAIPGDAVSATYARKCRALADGVEKEWDGVWNLTEK